MFGPFPLLESCSGSRMTVLLQETVALWAMLVTHRLLQVIDYNALCTVAWGQVICRTIHSLGYLPLPFASLEEVASKSPTLWVLGGIYGRACLLGKTCLLKNGWPSSHQRAVKTWLFPQVFGHTGKCISLLQYILVWSPFYHCWWLLMHSICCWFFCLCFLSHFVWGLLFA